MQLVTAVRHIHYIAQWLLRNRRSALCQQVRLLMLIAKEARLRCVGLAKHQVSDRLETRAAPRFKERIDPGPTVEHDGHAILFKHPICFRHRRLEPVCIFIVLNGASIAVAIVHQIRRIGEDEIDTCLWHLTHDFDAISMRDGVDELARLNGLECLHDLDPLCASGVICRSTPPEGARVGRSQSRGRAFSEAPGKISMRTLQKDFYWKRKPVRAFAAANEAERRVPQGADR